MLRVEGLRVSYGELAAVRGIDFEVRPGEIVALIGANGAGKTTTLMALIGVLPCEGRIWLDGVDIRGWPSHQIVKRGIGVVPEGRRVIGTLTVQENLEMGAFNRRDAGWKDDLEAVTARFPVLAERRTQLASTLSGGEQQMLAIARVLMARPTLLLMDEPSMGLAPKVIEEVFRIIVDINRSGTSVLLVEQNAYLALRTASRAYVLERGQIVRQGDSKELAEDARLVKAYLG